MGDGSECSSDRWLAGKMQVSRVWVEWLYKPPSAFPLTGRCSCAGARIQIRALTAIAAGEQLTVSYTNLMELRSRRQADLLKSKHFSCACLRCRQPLAQSTDRLLEVPASPPPPLPPRSRAREAGKLLGIYDIWTTCPEPAKMLLREGLTNP